MEKETERKIEEYIAGLKKAYEEGCAVCPENRGFDDWQGRLPCGQQNCWAEIHKERGFF